MRLAIMKMTALAIVLGSAVAAQPAFADKGGKGPKHGAAQSVHAEDDDDNDQGEHRDGDGNRDRRGGEGDVFGFNNREVDIITGILRGLYGGEDKVEFTRPSSRAFCPPGLAKKNNGCMPPGQAKKYAVGQRLSDDAHLRGLPRALADALGVPPPGKKYVRVDNDVLLIEEATKLVLDAVGVNRR